MNKHQACPQLKSDELNNKPVITVRQNLCGSFNNSMFTQPSNRYVTIIIIIIINIITFMVISTAQSLKASDRLYVDYVSSGEQSLTGDFSVCVND